MSKIRTKQVYLDEIGGQHETEADAIAANTAAQRMVDGRLATFKASSYYKSLEKRLVGIHVWKIETPSYGGHWRDGGERTDTIGIVRGSLDQAARWACANESFYEGHKSGTLEPVSDYHDLTGE